MKKAIAAIAIVGSLIASRLIYPETLAITQLDYDTDTVTLETATGLIYHMNGCEDYIEGELVSAIMWSNGTEIVADDTIIGAQYSGYTILCVEAN